MGQTGLQGVKQDDIKCGHFCPSIYLSIHLSNYLIIGQIILYLCLYSADHLSLELIPGGAELINTVQITPEYTNCFGQGGSFKHARRKQGIQVDLSRVSVVYLELRHLKLGKIRRSFSICKLINLVYQKALIPTFHTSFLTSQ